MAQVKGSVGEGSKTEKSYESELYANKVLEIYTDCMNKMQDYFPKVDQRLILDIVRFQTMYQDWEGSVLLKLVYPSSTDLKSKEEWILRKFNRVPSVEEDRTLRFKGIKIYLQVLEQIIEEDKDIEFITGSATLAPSDSYSA